MNRFHRIAVVVATLAALPTVAQHSAVAAADLKWAPVPSLPAGAQIAVIEGPMNEAKPFTVRLRLPANYRIPPHTHPATERVTLLSGAFNMGMGEKFEAGAGHAMAVGDVMIMQPGTPHFAWTGGAEAVVQLHGNGPWGVQYVNAADDPRKK